MQYLGYFIGLIITVIIEILMFRYISKRSSKRTPVLRAFRYTILCMSSWCIGLIIQILIINYTNINPLFVDYFIYIPVVFLPIALFYVAISFAKDNNVDFKKKYGYLFIVPLITIFIVWTNSIHHLFYKSYSVHTGDTVFGNYFYVHSIYTYGLFAVSIFIMLKNSIKNSGMFSMQSLLIALGALVPVAVNFSGMTIFDMNIYVTPISFFCTVILHSIAILKYDFLNVSPIALKRIVNQMSDLYIVLNKDGQISDCNEPFERVFGIKKEKIIGKAFLELDFASKIIIKNKKIGNFLEKVQSDKKVYTVDASLKDQSKYFSIEISGIFSDNHCVGILILFKDTTQHILDMETLKQNQNTMMERERLATLGQMVGGIAHNLKTPIMSIAGAMSGLEDLINEYDSSIDDPEVTASDHHDIAKDMREWITKVNSYDSYMSDIISAVKGQAVNMTDDTPTLFTIKELLSRINILMKHELKNAGVTLNTLLKVDEDSEIVGNINSLVQVINNLISNAIQSYGGRPNGIIDLIIDKKSDNIVLQVIDHGSGIPEDIQKKLFSEMVTTKGHNGTGLGLFMSYSTIKGHFNGDMNFTSKIGEGTTFNVILPMKSKTSIQ